MPPPFGAGAQVLDALYRPVRSSHEPLQRLSSMGGSMGSGKLAPALAQMQGQSFSDNI